MQKEFYKLALVFVMISFSFVLAFFLGREVTLAGLKDQPVEHATNLDSKSIFENKDDGENGISDEFVHSINKKISGQSATNQDTDISVNKNSKDSLDGNKDSLAENKNQQSTIEPDSLSPSPPPIYGLFVADYSTKEQAMEKSSQLKLRFPNWKIFFKRSNSMYRVYIGPFMQKQLAEDFLNELGTQEEFSSLKVTKILTRKAQKKSQPLQ